MKTFPWLLLAALALAQASASQVDCANRSVCSDANGKVCGSDGITYDDKCAFEAAYCDNPSYQLSIVSEGACSLSEEAATPAPTTTVEVPVAEEDSPVTPAPTTTVLPPVEDEAVTTTVTTTSDSTADEVELSNSDFQQIVIDIPATTEPAENAASSYPTPDPTTASPDPRTTSFEVTAAGAIRSTKCNPICPKVYAPVCGSDSVTYANQCLLDYASCRTGAVVKIGDGKCTKRKKGESCVPEVCTSVEDPCCGSDGTTYLNMCMFENAQCLVPELSKAHDGECNANTNLTCATLTCPMLTECHEDAETGVAYCADICAAERCGAGQECQLLKGDCFTAPCSAVATCVSADIEMF